MKKSTTTQKKNYDPKFKATVAMAALSQLHTREAVAKQYGINKTQVNSWCKILQDNAAQLYVKGQMHLLPDNSEEISNLKQIIGDLTMENALLKKNYINACKTATGAD